ncbi:MAG: hypothetical protein ACE15B_12395 [Bryobacteraceae bacterium]
MRFAVLLAAAALSAQTQADAVRDIARRIAASVNEPVALTGHAEAVRGELVRAGVELAAASGTEVRITASESWSERLLVAEIRRGEERTVLISAWPRGERERAPSVSITRTLLREQKEPILDAAETGDGTLVILEPARVVLHGKVNASVAIDPAPAPSRDPRGRLLLDGDVFRVWLAGVTCRGTLAAPPAIECARGAGAWPLENGARAQFRAGRNYFERQDGPPFYSAAFTGGRWIYATVDGRGFADVAGTGCGFLAVPAGADTASVRVFNGSGGEPAPAGPPVEFNGPVTALWRWGQDAAIVVSRDARTGDYAAYRLLVACAR